MAFRPSRTTCTETGSPRIRDAEKPSGMRRTISALCSAMAGSTSGTLDRLKARVKAGLAVKAASSLRPRSPLSWFRTARGALRTSMVMAKLKRKSMTNGPTNT